MNNCSCYTDHVNISKMQKYVKWIVTFQIARTVIYNIVILIIFWIFASNFDQIPPKNVGVTIFEVAFVLILIGTNIQVWLSASNKIRTSREMSTSKLSQYVTDTQVTYKTNYSVGRAIGNEQVVTWIGPVVQNGQWSYIGPTLKETNRQAINTLIFTDRQIVGIMLATADVKGFKDGYSDIFNSLNSASASQDQYLFMMNYHKYWPVIVAELLKSPLEEILQTHINMGIQYSDIQSINITKNFLQARIIKIILKSGHELSFSVTFTNLDQIRSLLQPLQQHLQIIS